MADKFLHELDAIETLKNEDRLLISKKVSDGNYVNEYAEVGTLSTYINTSIQGELNDHIQEKDTTDKLHITSNERSLWTNAANAINDFLSDDAELNETIDTLKEIQNWFANEENKTAASILEAIASLQAENETLKKKLAAYDERFGYTEDENKNVSWTVNFLKINSPAKS